MARSVNRVTLLGRLGAHPDTHWGTGNQSTRCKLSIATNYEYVKKGTDEKVVITTWHRVVAWGPVAEACDRFLEKGQQVFVDGRLENRSWEDDEGNTRYITEVIVKDIVFLSGYTGERFTNAKRID